ncbi:MAG TPA: sigma-54-dependent Fis family transcriptional regulator [Nevskia sp.]|nr:sigma-54-dependent Fis family transcriptional regulator [Nevskia sp.]
MRLRQDSQGHLRLIETALKGRVDDTGVGQEVRNSWSRCLSAYSLDPLQVKKPLIVERADLEARREKIGAVLPIARIEMLGLSRHMHHSQYGIMLTDSDGVILSYVGDPAFSMTARRSGFREGAVWSEQELGTNGMGTCLMTREPIVIHRSDHFLVQNTELTCSAAPIFDMQGRLLAALDISGASTGSQSHTLALVDIAAQNIENRALLNACRRYQVLRFHRCEEFVSTPGEGVLAFDEGGTILGANRAALEMLGHRDHKSLCGQRIDTILDAPLAGLLQMGVRHGFRPEPLSTRFGHQKFFAVVQPPADEFRRAPKSVVVGSRVSDTLDMMQPSDPVMVRNVQILRRVLNRDISVLLLGETGTGKGYFAKAIHNASRRADKPFVAVNCAAIPEMLIESELFGYKPGAFTGATREGNVGRILQANGGTLFLDEIGDMPLALQARLLTVIEEREVVPLGASKPVAVDIRVISATHRDPVEMISRGNFRDDLYYRLNGITLTIPPLRERKDAADVVRYMLRLEAGERTPVQIEEALVQRLARYSWPGNLRQLRNVLCMMLALRESDYLTLDDFDEAWLNGGRPQAAPAGVPAVARAEADEDNVLGSAECEALRRTLEACHWNVSAAAVRLHLSRKTMYRKMHRHGLVRNEQFRRHDEPAAPQAVAPQGDGAVEATGIRQAAG